MKKYTVDDIDYILRRCQLPPSLRLFHLASDFLGTFTIDEMCSLTGKSYVYVSRILAKLVKVGILKKTKSGKVSSFRCRSFFDHSGKANIGLHGAFFGDSHAFLKLKFALMVLYSGRYISATYHAVKEEFGLSQYEIELLVKMGAMSKTRRSELVSGERAKAFAMYGENYRSFVISLPNLYEIDDIFFKNHVLYGIMDISGDVAEASTQLHTAVAAKIGCRAYDSFFDTIARIFSALQYTIPYNLCN